MRVVPVCGVLLLLLALSGCAAPRLVTIPLRPQVGAAVSSAPAGPVAATDPAASPAAGDLRVTFLDVGQGDATLLQAPDATMLVDTGRHDRSEVVPALTRLGVERLDVVAITHPHADHVGQLAEVLAAVPVAEVWMPGSSTTTNTFAEALDALAASEAGYEEPRAGDRTTVGALTVDVVNPVEPLTGDLHADSLALRVTFGAVSVLFTGDAEAGTEALMAARDPAALAATVYQVGHHGSATSTSTAFLAAVAPQVAVYSAGAGNGYGHPDAGIVARLSGAGAEVFGTDAHGDVTVTTDGQTVTVTTTAQEPETAAPAPPPASLPLPTEQQAAACDPNYAGACVPVYPPDVNCPRLEATDITVVGRDVHHLDGDDNGVGCQS